MQECDRILNRFRSLNTKKESKQEANGMIAVFIDQGAKEEALLREVFGIGYDRRYYKILHNQSDKVGFGGRNNNAVSDDMIEQLHRFSMHGVPTELGYPCGEGGKGKQG